MYQNFKVKAVTPAGRKRYMEVLSPYIFLNRDIIDKWIIWVNTPLTEDIQYCESLYDKNPDFVDLIRHESPITRPMPQAPFFKTTIDKDTIYIKFDDDICYIHQDAIKNLLAYRVENPKHLFVMANTICNGYCAYIHQKYGAQDFFIDGEYQRIPPEFANKVWSETKYAEYVHRTFIKDFLNKEIEKYKFTSWELSNYERVAINCISWFGERFATFGGIIPHIDEELWLSCIKPKEEGSKNSICGKSLVAHFAFYKHRKPFATDKEIDHRILESYRQISLRAKGEVVDDKKISKTIANKILV